LQNREVSHDRTSPAPLGEAGEGLELSHADQKHHPRTTSYKRKTGTSA
jgi:hypothetical protein